MRREARESASRPLGAHQVRQIAVAAVADPRSVTRVLSGEHVRASVERRIERAIEELGLVEPGREPERRDSTAGRRGRR